MGSHWKPTVLLLMSGEPVSLPEDSGLQPGYLKAEGAGWQAVSRLEEHTCLELRIRVSSSE